MSDAPTEFHVEVVRVGEVTKHPNADSLSVTNVLGYPVVIRTGDFQPGDLAVYVPVDALVPTSRPEFAFLAKPGIERHRVRAARLRGIFSMGLLVKAPFPTAEGQDVASLYDVTKYEPAITAVSLSGNLPKGVARARTSYAWMPVYGVEAYRRNTNVLQEGENVVVTEKLHGTNARYAYRGGKLYVGSHKVMRGTTRGRIFEALTRVKLWALGLFKKHRAGLLQSEGDVWWQMAEKLDLKKKLAGAPDVVIYGEIVGPGVQAGFDYGLKEREFFLFDVLDIKAGRYLDYNELLDFANEHDFNIPPVLYQGPYSAAVLGFADGKTTLAGKHIREGVVIKASPERTAYGVGRVSLKVISEAYLLDKAS